MTAQPRSEAAPSRYVAEYERLAPRLAGRNLPWLEGIRRDAIGRFGELGFPTPRDEAWRYTNVSPIARRAFLPTPGERPPESELEALREAVARQAAAVPGAIRLTFVDGVFAATLSETGTSPESQGGGRGAAGTAVVQSLAAVLESEPDVVALYLGRAAKIHSCGFAALNAAFIHDGAFIHLPAELRLDRCVHLIYLSRGEADHGSYPRNLIVAEAGSSATVVESYLTLGDGGQLTNATSEVFLHEGAQITHYRMQGESDRSYHIGVVEVTQRADSHYRSYALGLGGRLARCDINISLEGRGARCELDGLYLACGRGHVDFHTRVDHREPEGTSRQVYKGIVDGHGRAVFNGQVMVHPDAQRSDASQANHNLLLSRDAEIDTKPQLEIHADDVKCSHGATVGQLDDEMLFYLRSRGLDEGLARAALTHAFAQEVLDRMGLPEIREQITGELARLLPAAQRAGAALVGETGWLDRPEGQSFAEVTR